MIFIGKHEDIGLFLVPTDYADFTDDVRNVMNRYFKLYVPMWLETTCKEYPLKNLNCLIQHQILIPAKRSAYIVKADLFYI